MTEHQEVVRRFVLKNWNEEQVAFAFAFASDKKMNAMNPCNCFVGLHNIINNKTGGLAYLKTKKWFRGMREAEIAYMNMGLDGLHYDSVGVNATQDRRDVLFCDILQQVMKERERATIETPSQVCVSA